MITLADIEQARARIGDAVYVSPCAYSETFSKLTGIKIWFKLENLQMSGSFKERGALNKLSSLTAEERRRGVIAASAGNHAQGVAYHATRLGIRSTIVMPETTPLIKVMSTREFGGDVVMCGASFDEALEEALRRAERDELTFIHAFDDPLIVAGTGTIGLELLEQMPGIEAVVAPIGGGGLLAGIACALRAKRPGVRVVGVQAARVPSATAALAAGAPQTVPPANTIADGIAVRRVGQVTAPMLRDLVDEVVLVDEEEIANAILLLLEREKTVAEGAGAAAVAAVLNHKTSLTLGKHTAIILSGGNIDVNVLARVIERGLAKDGRLVKLEVKISDRPGSLARLISLVAQTRASVKEINHLRTFSGVELGDTIVDLVLETRGSDHVEEIVTALRQAGYEHRRRRG